MYLDQLGGGALVILASFRNFLSLFKFLLLPKSSFYDLFIYYVHSVVPT